MRIRQGLTKDDDAIIDCLRKFADYQPWGKLKAEAEHYNDHHVRKILDAIRKKGIMLVAEDVEKRSLTKPGDIAGVFMAIVAPDIWLPQLVSLNELVWWVNPEYRETTVGYRLFKEYQKIGEQMVKDKKINNFTMTLLENSPKIDLEKRGWDKVETNYVFGA